jgi:hypothetical protein
MTRLNNDVFLDSYDGGTRYLPDTIKKLAKFMLVKKALIVFAENCVKKKALSQNIFAKATTGSQKKTSWILDFLAAYDHWLS